MANGTDRRLFHRLPAYCAGSAAGFITLYFSYRNSGILPLHEPLWQWTAVGFAIGCLSPTFGLVAWALFRRGDPRATQWVIASAITLIAFALSPARSFLAAGLVGSVFFLAAGADGFRVGRTIFALVFVLAWLATVLAFFGVGRTVMAQRNTIEAAGVRSGSSLWVIAAISAVVGAVAWFDAGRKPEAWESAKTGAPKGFTYDTTAVPLGLGGASLLIPRAYIWPWGPSADPNKRRNMEAINIEAHLPDIEPIQPVTADCFTHQTECHDVVFGFLLAGDPPPIERQFSGRAKAHPGELPIGPFNLHVIADEDNLLLLEASLDDEIVAYECIRSTHTCFFNNGALLPGISYSYQIDQSQLEHWMVIHASIRARFRSFAEQAPVGH